MTQHHTNILAILSLIFAFLIFPLGFILGIFALRQIKKTHEEGHGLAVAGIVISILSFIGYIWLLAALGIIFGTVASIASGDLDQLIYDSRYYIDSNLPGSSVIANKAPLQKPLGKYYENTQNGITLIVSGYRFEKKSDDYGKLKSITLIMENKGTESIIPQLLINIIDKDDKKYTTGKEVSVTSYLEPGSYIAKDVIVDIAIAGSNNQKEIGIHVTDYMGGVIASVRFDTNFMNGFE